jgi:ABC-type molybdate transport system substrate-binding protein
MFLYSSAALDLSLPYLVLPDEINLGNPAMAPFYEGVQFTNNKGQTFHGKPISFSAAVLKNANNPHAAQHFIESLLSPIGQKFVQAAHFLPSPNLVGGDKTSVPGQLMTLIQGDYQYPG